MDPVKLLVACRLLQTARGRVRPASPAELARRLDPKFVVTPTIRLISDIAVRSVRDPNQRDVVSAPPRTGKSEELAVWLPVWALMPDPAFPMKGPDLKIMIISNGDDLARAHSRKVRDIIREHAGFLGFNIAPDKTAAGQWNVQGHDGAMLAAGISSHIVGFGADLMILDDLVGSAAEADSEAHRKRILAEYQGSLAARVHPGGSILLVMTRWHEEDIAGALLKLEPDQWRATNITAVGERGIPDALGKDPGVAMTSALGFIPEDYARRRRTVGDRMWYAQYMGKPSNPAGSLIKSAWITQHRLAAAPRSPIYTVVGVDPADSGKGDECGIVATTLFGVGRVAMIADKSGRMTSDQWALAAVDLAIEVGASEIGVEGFAARETYTRVVREAIRRRQDEGKLHRDIIVTGWPPKGSGRGGGDAIARAAPLRQDLEVGTLVLAGEFPTFEEQATAWQPGQHQPDRLSALIVGHDLCVHAAGQEWGMASPADYATTGGGSGRPEASVTDIEDWMRQKLA
ncbi:hypothetical protein B1R94_02270 [Mycolicibacterium litorale]|nr:hypothetical protein B1R94_02270 [Mycolicibacterium litorale]